MLYILGRAVCGIRQCCVWYTGGLYVVCMYVGSRCCMYIHMYAAALYVVYTYVCRWQGCMLYTAGLYVGMQGCMYVVRM